VREVLISYAHCSSTAICCNMKMSGKNKLSNNKAKSELRVWGGK